MDGKNDKKQSSSELSTKKFTSDVAIRFITAALLQVQSFIFLPIITKTLGAESYGIWSQIIITLNLLTPILMLRLEGACVRYLGSHNNKKIISKTFFSMLALIWFCVILIVILVFLFPDKFSFFIFGEENLILYSEFFGIMLFTGVTQAFILNYYRTFNKFNILSIINIIQSFSEIGLMMLFILYFDIGLKGAILSIILVETFGTIVVLTHIIKSIGFTFNSDIRVKLKPYLKYSIPLIPEGALFWAINLSDRYVIIHLLNLTQAGIYSASYALSGAVTFFTVPISYVLFPSISKLWENKDIINIKKYIEASIKYFLILAIPSTIGVCYLSPYLIKSLTTSEFVTSRLLITLIVLSYVFWGIYQMLYYIIHLKEKTHLVPIFFGAIAVLNLVLNFIWVPIYGIIGAAFSTFIAFTILLLIVFFLSQRWLPIHMNYKSILKSIISSCIMLVPLIIFIPRTIFEIIGLIFIGFIVYLGCMILFKGIGKTEWNLIKSTIIHMRGK